MVYPESFDYSTAFAKKLRSFIKYYTLTRKDPLEMIVNTLNDLENILNVCEDISSLEPLSEDCKSITKYDNKETLFQIQVLGEKNRYIIYCPRKLLGLPNSNEKETLILDMLFIPSS